ncbi:hypothetical protein [Nannocystis sp.]|uniref:hypothetical protein n=1 Tax=Nannocystis sp. TaxID=1962667 RepID=UPI0024256277|nr:hypothetical protein [Nannocystis sp.]MBK7829417.1 hypothetical protein [Nannocystis sp.]MBK9753461.1 hypothetical protein [Nannocystis sp.]
MPNLEKLRPGVLNQDVRRVRAPWLLTAALLLACPADEDAPTTSEDATDTSTEDSTAPTTTAATSTPSTDDSNSTTADDPQAETTETTSGSTTAPDATTTDATGTTSADTTSTTDATTGGSATLPEACHTLCVKALGECDIPWPLDSVDLCTQSCINNFAEDMGACREAAIDYLDCVVTLECPAISNAIFQGEPGDCVDAAVVYNDVCSN